MIGENFIDICVNACMNIDSSRKRCKELFTNICIVLKWYKDETPKDKYPIEYANKLDLAFLLSNYRVKHAVYNKNILIDKISSGRYKTFVNYLDNMCINTNPPSNPTPVDEVTIDATKTFNDMSNEDFEVLFNTIHTKRKACDILNGKKNIQKLMDDIECGNYIDDDEIIDRWESCITSSYSNYMKIKRHESIEKAESLDLANDNLSIIFDKIRNATDKKNTISSGYDYLDKALPCGGFENRRLYLIGGTSGVGKSTKLINLITNAVKQNKVEAQTSTYLYITAENLIDESWIRFFCCATGITHKNLLSLINYNRINKENQTENDNTQTEDVDDDDTDDKEQQPETKKEERKPKIEDIDNLISKELRDILNKTNSNVIFKYVEPKRTTTTDVESIVDIVASENNLKAIYIDYLDLIRVGNNNDMELRHELGLVAQTFKNIAITYSVPVITATQLNRSGYAPDSQPTLIQMSESMEKVDNSDFVLFLQQGREKRLSYIDPITNASKVVKPIRASILKNRNGTEGEVHTCEMPLTTDGIDTFNYKILQTPTLKPENINVDVSKKTTVENTPF
jgi:replicative DNA helicase